VRNDVIGANNAWTNGLEQRDNEAMGRGRERELAHSVNVVVSFCFDEGLHGIVAEEVMEFRRSPGVHCDRDAVTVLGFNFRGGLGSTVGALRGLSLPPNI